nr:MAG TPA: hypothetical protein [Caudoviricetes sp.]
MFLSSTSSRLLMILIIQMYFGALPRMILV